jgi:exodeoxyribonuclease V alpha subunit
VPVTVIGEVERVTFENEESGFRVLRVGSLEGEGARPGSVAVVGTFPAVGPGMRVRITGDFQLDGRHGEQLKVQSLVPVAPSTLDGLARYLGSGIIPGVGPAFAQRIVDHFKMESLDVLDREPGRLREVAGIGSRRAEQIAKTWAAERAMNGVMLLLQSHGASAELAARIVRHYGDRAASVVEQSPYRLALEVRGIGFKTADRLARSLGIAGDHPERVQAGALHELEGATAEGHTFAPREGLIARAAAMLGVGDAHVESALDQLWAAGRVVLEKERVYLARLHRAEVELAGGLARLASDHVIPLANVPAALSAFETRAGLSLAPGQRRALEVAAAHHVTVITGGPGVGKTTIIKALVDVFERERRSVRLAAPTGRAAKRLAEASAREATTLHRLLEFDPRLHRFQRDEQHPLDADVIVVDEASMIDVPLAAALVSALPTAARLVIVGDSDQLPSVGPGAFLRDVLASGVAESVRLNEIFRQAGESRIVQNAHRILHGEVPESAPPDDPKSDFFVVTTTDPAKAADTLLRVVLERIPERFGFLPGREIQVLTPMHRGPVGTMALNERLQQALNAGGRVIPQGGGRLRIGDRVMQTRNDHGREVYNGDLGVVTALDPEDGLVRVTFEQRDVVYEAPELDALVLAYATSIHKSQGSEYPAVVVPLLTSHFVMLSRNLLYTAVTRAKKLCVLVADPRALKLALAEIRREDRLTGLVDRLREASRFGP